MANNPATVFLPITSCSNCPNCSKTRWYTADSFEYIEAWNCRLVNGGKNGTTDREEFKSPPGIALMETFDKDPPIPAWCPLTKVPPIK